MVKEGSNVYGVHVKVLLDLLHSDAPEDRRHGEVLPPPSPHPAPDKLNFTLSSPRHGYSVCCRRKVPSPLRLWPRQKTRSHRCSLPNSHTCAGCISLSPRNSSSTRNTRYCSFPPVLNPLPFHTSTQLMPLNY